MGTTELDERRRPGGAQRFARESRDVRAGGEATGAGLRMDHHCSWINNCVGLKNNKSFLLLLFYAIAGSTYSATVIICCTLEKNWDSLDNHPVKILHVVCGVMSIVVSLVLGSFLVWHIFLTCHNMTTIEYYDAKRAAWLARTSGLSYHHPYDIAAKMLLFWVTIETHGHLGLPIPIVGPHAFLRLLKDFISFSKRGGGQEELSFSAVGMERNSACCWTSYTTPPLQLHSSIICLHKLLSRYNDQP